MDKLTLNGLSVMTPEAFIEMHTETKGVSICFLRTCDSYRLTGITIPTNNPANFVLNRYMLDLILGRNFVSDCDTIITAKYKAEGNVDWATITDRHYE